MGIVDADVWGSGFHGSLRARVSKKRREEKSRDKRMELQVAVSRGG